MSPAQKLLEDTREHEHPLCLFCGSKNPIGFKLPFTALEDGSVRADITCGSFFQSYPRTLHGGVISALLDSAMTNCLFARGVVAVTGELNVRFVEAVDVDRAVEVRAAVEREYGPLYQMRAELTQSRRVRARATAKFVKKGFGLRG